MQMKNKQLYSYIVWGILSAILNVGLAELFVLVGIDYRISNAITLVIVKLFSYFTNKIFVFKTPFESVHKFIVEMIRFIFARWVTFLVDYFGVIILVEILKQSFFLSKCLMSAIVVVLNYILSKKIVFRGKNNIEE